MDTKQHLKKFFVVTRTSMYEVAWNEDEESPKSTVVKVAIRHGSSSEIPVGEGLYGHFVVLGDEGMLTTYSADRGTLTGHTSDIVALFLNLDSADKCLRATGHLCPDPRWKRQTQAVLNHLMGRDHPVFVFPKAMSMWSDLARKPIAQGRVRIRMAMPE